jgi:hypothetical protein
MHDGLDRATQRCTRFLPEWSGESRPTVWGAELELRVESMEQCRRLVTIYRGRLALSSLTSACDVLALQLPCAVKTPLNASPRLYC